MQKPSYLIQVDSLHWLDGTQGGDAWEITSNRATACPTSLEWARQRLPHVHKSFPLATIVPVKRIRPL